MTGINGIQWRMMQVLLIVTLLSLLSACKATKSGANSTDTTHSQAADRHNEGQLTQVAISNKQIMQSLDQLDTISVQEYKIKRASLFRITFSNKLLFEFSKHDASKINVDDIRAFVRLYNQKTLGAYLYVVGHTDSVGSALKNQSLSAQRGFTIANLLVQNGISANKIKVVAAGESIPAASNKTRASQAKNRRVEILSSNSMALNLAFFRQFDCSDIDPACRPGALPVFDVVKSKGNVVMRMPPKGQRRIETMTQKIKRRAFELPMQIRQSLNIKLDVRKVLLLAPKYWLSGNG